MKYTKLADFEDLVPHVKAGTDLAGDELLVFLTNGDRNMVTVRYDLKRWREQLDSPVTRDPRKIKIVIGAAEVAAQDLIRALDRAQKVRPLNRP